MSLNYLVRTILVATLSILCGRSLAAQAALTVQQPAAPLVKESLPDLILSPDDLIEVSVYDAPEFSGRYRLSPSGAVVVPMLSTPVSISGVRPQEAAQRIAAALNDEQLLVKPTVSVSVIEYKSREVTVSGAVKKPSVLPLHGHLTLLDALSLCDGLADNAGPNVVVLRSPSVGQQMPEPQQIAVGALMSGNDPGANVVLTGGEEVRVPEAGKVYVLGNVKKPGVIEVRDADTTSVLRVLALSDGLAPYSSDTAYIYRKQQGQATRQELPVPLKRITDRKTTDVALLPGDIFYIPDNKGKRNLAGILDKTLALGGGVSAAVVYAGVH